MDSSVRRNAIAEESSDHQNPAVAWSKISSQYTHERCAVQDRRAAVGRQLRLGLRRRGRRRRDRCRARRPPCARPARAAECSRPRPSASAARSATTRGPARRDRRRAHRPRSFRPRRSPSGQGSASGVSAAPMSDFRLASAAARSTAAARAPLPAFTRSIVRVAAGFVSSRTRRSPPDVHANCGIFVAASASSL